MCELKMRACKNREEGRLKRDMKGMMERGMKVRWNGNEGMME